MKIKHLTLAITALLAVGGLWFAWSAWRTHSSQKSIMGIGSKMSQGRESGMGNVYITPQDSPKPGPVLHPPNPSRRFTNFTPEQRVQFARQGHGPGG